MSFMKNKSARRAAIGLTAVALVIGVSLPTAVVGQVITLTRACSDSNDPTCPTVPSASRAPAR